MDIVFAVDIVVFAVLIFNILLSPVTESHVFCQASVKVLSLQTDIHLFYILLKVHLDIIV
jgi:hypothetical protein